MQSWALLPSPGHVTLVVYLFWLSSQESEQSILDTIPEAGSITSKSMNHERNMVDMASTYG
jgi:hypothetical protein